MLQIVRPDIVVPLAEYRPSPELSATLRSARLQPLRDHEARAPAPREREPRPGTAAALRAYTRPAGEEAPLAAGRFMSQPVTTLHLGATIRAARELFLSSGFQHLPLVDAAGRIAAMLSERDLLRAAPAVLSANPAAGAIATREVLVCRADTAVDLVASAMLEHHFGGVPVVDGSLHVLGILTHSDILRALLLHAPRGLQA